MIASNITAGVLDLLSIISVQGLRIDIDILLPNERINKINALITLLINRKSFVFPFFEECILCPLEVPVLKHISYTDRVSDDFACMDSCDLC
jgi:hypothetical protein